MLVVALLAAPSATASPRTTYQSHLEATPQAACELGQRVVDTGDHTGPGCRDRRLAVDAFYDIPPACDIRRRPPFLSWGLVIAVLLWAVAARAFTIYLANFPSYNKVYGSIGAVAILMIWIYVSAYSVLLGAAFDAERNRQAIGLS